MKELFTYESLNDYKRNLNLQDQAIQESALFLHKSTGRNLEECLEFTKRKVQEQYKDPDIRYLERNKYGDRELKFGKLSNYIKTAVQNKYILSGSLTCYMHPDEKESIIGKYLVGNLAKRDEQKGLRKKARANNDPVAEATADGIQNFLKRVNNSTSGAHNSTHNILTNKSSHPTLTSMCRTVATSANSNNERFLAGNRHYRDPRICLNNLISLVKNSNYEKIQIAMDLYNLHYPSTEDVVICLRNSIDKYWNWDKKNETILKFINGLSPIEKAAVVYSMDFWHLLKFNQEFVAEFMLELAIKKHDATGLNRDDLYSRLDADLIALFGLILADEIKEYKDGLFDKNLINDEKNHSTVLATMNNVFNLLIEYAPLYQAFWVTEHLPFSIYDYPDSIRDTVLVSDTDSTIFSVQDWVVAFCGKIEFTPLADAIAAIMVYLTSQITIHILAQTARNMGVADRHIPRIIMKNEFAFPVFGTTDRTKHYYNFVSACEGQVYKELKFDSKGVALRNSTIPKSINDRLHAKIQEVMLSIIKGEKLSLEALLTDVANIERGIVASIKSGDGEYLSSLSIKDLTAYKTNIEPTDPPDVQRRKTLRTNWGHHDLWHTVFAPKYGIAPALPYKGVKVNLDINNKTEWVTFLSKIEDKELQARLINWVEESGKPMLKTFIIPEDIARTKGIPDEIMLAINIRQMLSKLMDGFYLFLSTLGIHIKNANVTKLVSDDY